MFELNEVHQILILRADYGISAIGDTNVEPNSHFLANGTNLVQTVKGATFCRTQRGASEDLFFFFDI